jgi:sporulation protein YlmC with PRC-barrel domain
MATDVKPTSNIDETTRLISSEKVSGTGVENTNGDNLGHIDEIMIDKISGRVAYAVLNYGSFLGLGGKLFAIPWDILKYDTNRSSYVIGIPIEKLKDAPSFDAHDWPNLAEPAYGRRLHDYYGSTADWYLFP